MVTVKELNAALAASLNPIYRALSDMKISITEVETRLMEKFSSRVEGLEDRIKVLEASTLLHQKALDSWDWEKRKKNLIVRGLPEGEMSIDGKDVKDDKSKVIEVLKKVGGNLEMVDDFFRLGKREEGRSRLLIVKFVRSREKFAIKENSKKLKEAGPMWAKVFIFNDEPLPYRKEMKRLNIVFKAEKTNPDNARKTVIFDRKKKQVSVDRVCVDRFANQNL
jgi:hypothetical protein